MNEPEGFLNTEAMIDGMIQDCNNAVRQLAIGNYIAWCNLTVQMVQKLAALKKGYKDDIDGKNKRIEDLKEMLRNRGEDIIDVPAEELVKKDGAE